MKQVRGKMTQIPATIISLLGKEIPEEIPSPLEHDGLEAKHIIIPIIDNFGLFECVTFQPRFMIGRADYVYALETSNPLADNVIREVVTGGNDEFNLFDYLSSEDLSVTIIGREKYVENMATFGDIVHVANDHGVYVEAIKIVNRRDVVVLHFNDFEKLYLSKTTLDKETMAKKLITRTDSWLLTLMSYARPDTTMLIISNNGRNEPMNYPPELQQRRAASLPIAIGIKKK